ncbi:unnamed protein product [marine sediment metagenome]|uniref:Uncharacterized protein n=1 Tax=marine sediment metagenome TaxID=412755 RepID=X1CNF5_9ZZZZ
MTILDLSNQAANATAINPKIVALKNLMDLRKPIWDKLPVEKKKKWIKSGKDPIMTLAWQIFKYLRNNFFEEGVNDD